MNQPSAAPPSATLPDPGFTDPVFDAQASFRGVLAALSRPGTVQQTTAPAAVPAPLEPAMAALALALCDQDTPVWLDAAANAPQVADYLRFHCGCPLTEAPEDAAFALIADAAGMPPLASFAIGDDRYPDASATLIIGVPALEGGPTVTLRGPGIETTSPAAPQGLPKDFWTQMAANRALFPLGVDCVLASGTAVLGLPRTVTAEED